MGKDPTLLNKISKILTEHSTFLLATHKNADGDAIGSLLGMGNLLRTLKKEALLFHPPPLPTHFQFLPGFQEIQANFQTPENAILILLDCGDPERVGDENFVSWAKTKKSIVLDHHQTEKPFGTWVYVDPSASATGEIVFQLSRYLPVHPGVEFATCIYTAIFTDTGGFRFSNTTPSALQICGELVEMGANPQKIAEEVYENVEPERFLLLGEILSRMEIHLEGKISLITIRKEDLARYHLNDHSLEGFIDYPRSLKGVLCAVQIREVQEGKEYKVSLRSKGNLDVEKIARKWDGGGHKHAAGFTIRGNLDDVKNQVLTFLQKEIQNVSTLNNSQ